MRPAPARAAQPVALLLRPLLRLLLVAAAALFVYGLVTRSAIAVRSPLPFVLLAAYAVGTAALKLACAPDLARERMARLGLGPQHLPALEQGERLGAWPLLAVGAIALLVAFL